MRNRSMWLTLALVLVTTVLTAARQTAAVEQYVGMWAGTYDGVASGPFEIILDKSKDGGALTGKVNVTSDAGNYSADFKSVAIDGTKMTMMYDYPPDTSAEVVMTATFDGNTAKGTWSLRPKGAADELAGGGIAVNRK